METHPLVQLCEVSHTVHSAEQSKNDREVNFNLHLTTESIAVGSLRLASTSLQSRVMVVLFRGHVTAGGSAVT